MGRKKRPNAQQNNGQQQNNNDPKKKARINETGESYLVKKYRPTKIYTAMEAFVKYTKSHRMLDAAYIRTKIGVTADKPFVFSTRVGGVDLGEKGYDNENFLCQKIVFFAMRHWV
jgi:hypothetical protein